MGVCSCTGSNCEVGVLEYSAGWGLGCVGSSLRAPVLCSKLVDLQVSVSAEAPTLEEYKLSFSTAFIVTP